MTGAGPLETVRVVELASLGPVPFCAQLLGDLGAEVIRVDRPRPATLPGLDPYLITSRNKRTIEADLKRPEGFEAVVELLDGADVLLEGFRPGVAERLGLSPGVCLARNERLVYGRCTGWGRIGPLAERAGHDINYVALSGLLSLIGDPAAPPPPTLGLLGDHGGAGMLLTVGVLTALLERHASGLGQVVDASILEGALALSTPYHESLAQGERTEERWTTIADGSAPFYNCYETADGRYVAVGAIEPEFYSELLAVLGLDPAELPDQFDRASWPQLRATFAACFLTRPRNEWVDAARDRDCCLAPVLTLNEVPRHAQHRALGTFADVGGIVEPTALPRFSRTPAAPPRPARSHV